MRVRQLIEFAADLAANSDRVIGNVSPLPDELVDRYWQLTRKRNAYWHEILNDADQITLGDRESFRAFVSDVLCEIFITEVLTRVWGAILIARESRVNGSFHSAIARNVLTGHAYVKNRALNHVHCLDRSDDISSAGVERIRRSVDRWSDVLLQRIDDARRDYVASSARVQLDDVASPGNESTQAQDQVSWQLIFAGLRIGFPDAITCELPHAELDVKIAEVALKILPESAVTQSNRRRPLIGAVGSGPHVGSQEIDSVRSRDSLL